MYQRCFLLVAVAPAADPLQLLPARNSKKSMPCVYLKARQAYAFLYIMGGLSYRAHIQACSHHQHWHKLISCILSSLRAVVPLWTPCGLSHVLQPVPIGRCLCKRINPAFTSNLTQASAGYICWNATIRADGIEWKILLRHIS